MGDAAVDLEEHGPTRTVDHLPNGADLGEDLGEERLASEAGVDAHHEHQVGDAEDVADGVLVGRWVQDNSRQRTEVTHVLQCSMQMRTSFHVHAQNVGAGAHEVLEVPFGFDDHQVYVDRKLRGGTDGLYHRRPDCDVGHEAPVHNVHVNPVSASHLDRADLFRETAEIGRQNGGSDEQRTVGGDDHTANT